MPPSEKLSRHSFSCDYQVDYPTPPSPLSGYCVDGGVFSISTSMHPSTRARRPSRMKFRKYFGLLGPLYQIMRGPKTGSKDRNFDERDVPVPIDPRACRPRMSSVDEWCRHRDSDASIYEAILHCKRSAGIQQLNPARP